MPKEGPRSSSRLLVLLALLLQMLAVFVVIVVALFQNKIQHIGFHEFHNYILISVI